MARLREWRIPRCPPDAGLVFDVMSGDRVEEEVATFRNWRNIPSQIAFCASQSTT